MKIYIPQDNYYNKCYVVTGDGVIRGYNKIPSYNTDYSYRDYYIKSDYIYRDGAGSWGSYSTLPVCLSNDVITNDIYYRQDFDSILIIFSIMCIFCFYIPIKVFSRLFKKGGI